MTANSIEINRFVESAASAVSTINPNVRALTYFEIAYVAKLPRLISKMAQLSVFIITVTIRFSARGAYLLLAPQRRALIGDRALIRDRALI